MKSQSAKIFILITIALALASATNAGRGDTLAWFGKWDNAVETLAVRAAIPVIGLNRIRQSLVNGGALFIDARPRLEYNHGRVPGAFNISRENMAGDFAANGPLISKKDPLYVYCSNRECDDAYFVCRFLKSEGYDNVSLFVDGYEVWVLSGSPVER